MTRAARAVWESLPAYAARYYLRAARRFIGTAGRTCRFLWTVRAAIPWPVRALLGLAMVIKCLPLDFGTDELLTLVAVLILNKMRPGLMRACWRAAQIRA